MAKINGTAVDTLVIKNALNETLGTLTISDSGGNVSSGTFTISAEDASTYATSEYTVSDITCENGYIIRAQRTTTNGEYLWIHSSLVQMHQYLNASVSQAQGGTSLTDLSNNARAKIVNNHPVIQATNSSFPLIEGTYDILYW